MQKKYFKWNDFQVDRDVYDIEAERKAKEEAQRLAKLKEQEKKLIEFGAETPMGQMQKMFAWNPDQQECAIKMLHYDEKRAMKKKRQHKVKPFDFSRLDTTYIKK